MKKQLSIRTMTSVAVLSAVAFVLAFFEFHTIIVATVDDEGLPVTAAIDMMDCDENSLYFLTAKGKDFYDRLIKRGFLAFTPLKVKNLLGLFSTATGGVGELANFLMGASFAATAGLIYKQHKTKRTALIGGIIGSVVMGIVAALANYFILLPLFEQFMPLDQMIASFGAFIPFIKTKLDVVLYNAFPFNLLKGLVITGFTMLVYKRIRPLLKGKE